MSRFTLRSLVLGVLAAAAIWAGAAGFAGASSLESMLGVLEPSAAPPLLGPITEAGRKGWACKPEQAAAAKTAAAAELPSTDTH